MRKLRHQGIATVIALCAWAMVWAATALAADPQPDATKTGKDAAAPAKPAAEKEKAEKESKAPALPELSKELAALRDQVRRVLAAYFHQPLNTADSTPSDILAFSLAFGCDTEIRYGNSAGNAVSGIGCLCWNYPCAGYQLLMFDGSRPVARVGYGFQERPSQLLAVLAQSGVPAGYEVRLGSRRTTVAELVAAEQLDCVAETDLSLKLIGMSFYVTNGDSWKNRLGETWNVERLLREELNRPSPRNGCESLNRLMGVSYAVQRQQRLGRPIEGQFRRAADFTAEFQNYALGLQNSDGSWNPEFLTARGPGNDPTGSFRSTGYILEWLACSLPADRLEDARLVRSVSWTTAFLENNASRWNATASTPRDIDAVGHALHALRIYDRRVFKPHDRDQPDPDQEGVDKLR